MQMAELSQLADVAIGKPGGMSTMEFVKAGTKVIFDETSFRLHWERFNADVVVNSGRGMIMKNPDQILSLIKESLKSPRRTPMRMAQTRASEQYVDVVHRQLTAANSTAAEHGWREKRRSWHKMNKRMAITTIG
jgi:UDP-N-acetylglucosamine:LPS N-acetylglucosamine transferase